MPRKKKKARSVSKPKRIWYKPKPKVEILPVCRWQDDRVSTGRLVAIAEWKGGKA